MNTKLAAYLTYGQKQANVRGIWQTLKSDLADALTNLRIAARPRGPQLPVLKGDGFKMAPLPPPKGYDPRAAGLALSSAAPVTPLGQVVRERAARPPSRLMALSAAGEALTRTDPRIKPLLSGAADIGRVLLGKFSSEEEPRNLLLPLAGAAAVYRPAELAGDVAMGVAVSPLKRRLEDLEQRIHDRRMARGTRGAQTSSSYGVAAHPGNVARRALRTPLRVAGTLVNIGQVALPAAASVGTGYLVDRLVNGPRPEKSASDALVAKHRAAIAKLYKPETNLDAPEKRDEVAAHAHWFERHPEAL